MFAKFGNTVVHMLDGGHMLKISSRGKIYEFEMHPFCGPALLNRKGEALKNQPGHFLKAVSLWARQGERIENGLCRWDHESEPILEHIVGNHWKITGYKEPKKGS